MRWKLKARPKEGDLRIVKKFALIPKKISEHIVWLEYYSSYQEKRKHWDEFGSYLYWVETDRGLL